MSWFGKIVQAFSSQRARSHEVRSLACRERDLGEMRKRLEQDQGMLTQEVENVFALYDERLRSLSSRVHQLTDEEIATEEKFLSQAQEELRAIVRRLEAAVKSRRELERELVEWEDRKADSRMSADHPRMRVELIRSELAARQLADEAVDDASRDETLAVQPSDDWKLQERESCPAAMPVEPLHRIQPEQLVALIREATREADRWHALPDEAHTDDALVHMHHVRDLHALLKQIDREQGMQRDRVALAVRVRG